MHCTESLWQRLLSFIDEFYDMHVLFTKSQPEFEFYFISVTAQISLLFAVVTWPYFTFSVT